MFRLLARQPLSPHPAEAAPIATHSAAVAMAQKTTLKEFESVYPKLEEAILDHARSYKLPEAELSWLKKVPIAALPLPLFPWFGRVPSPAQ